MSTHIEKTKAFRRLYVATDQLMNGFEGTGNSGPFNEPCIERAITNINEMISRLPFEFPLPSLRSSTDRIIPINMNDAEDEPQREDDKFPEQTAVYFESTAINDLRFWKLMIWSRVVYFFPDPPIVDKYKPLVLEQ